MADRCRNPQIANKTQGLSGAASRNMNLYGILRMRDRLRKAGRICANFYYS